MALGVGLRCIKYLLFAFNLVFVLAGIAFIAIGALALNASKQVGALVSSPTAGAVFIIAIGVIVFVIAFFGCCGAARESYCLMVAFAVSLAIVFVLQLAIGIYGIVEKNKIEKTLPQLLNQTLSNYWTNQASMQAWDLVQNTYLCCGLSGPANWHGRQNNSANSVPNSCCIASKRNQTNCGANVLAQPQSNWGSYVYTNGCYVIVSSSLSRSAVIIAVVALLLAVVQLLGITCASCLAHEINNQYQPL